MLLSLFSCKKKIEILETNHISRSGDTRLSLPLWGYSNVIFPPFFRNFLKNRHRGILI